MSVAQWHDRLNTVLTVLVLALGVGILIYTAWPFLTFHFQKKFPPSQPTYVTGAATKTTPPNDIPKDNRLVIPQIFVDEVIREGKAETTVNNGPWRKPYSSTPLDEGNTVIAGHRFTYRSKAVFYNLDKLKIGDTFAVYWHGKAHYYQVAETKVVKANNKEVEAPTDTAQLTLYTCTPVWNPKDRLVVIAKPTGDTP